MIRYKDEKDKGAGRNVTGLAFHGVHNGVEEIPAIDGLIG